MLQVRVYDMTTMICQQEMIGHTDIVLCLDSCVSAAGVPLLASSGKDHTVTSYQLKSYLIESMQLMYAQYILV